MRDSLESPDPDPQPDVRAVAILGKLPEMAVELAAAPSLPLDLSPLTALRLCALLQLVLRRPDLPPAIRETADGLLVVLRAHFADLPVTAAAIALGDDPAYDLTAEG